MEAGFQFPKKLKVGRVLIDLKIMNDIIQNILVFTAMVLAMTFLIKKFFWKKSKPKKACGGDDGCGCH